MPTAKKTPKKAAEKTPSFVRQVGPGQYETKLRYAMADGRPREMIVKLAYLSRKNGVPRYRASYIDLDGKARSLTYSALDEVEAIIKFYGMEFGERFDRSMVTVTT